MKIGQTMRDYIASLEILEAQYLGKYEYLSAPCITITDLVCVTELVFAKVLNIDLSMFPRISCW